MSKAIKAGFTFRKRRGLAGEIGAARIATVKARTDLRVKREAMTVNRAILRGGTASPLHAVAGLAEAPAVKVAVPVKAVAVVLAAGDVAATPEAAKRAENREIRVKTPVNP